MRFNLLFSLALGAITTLGAPALAQDVVGTSTVEGRAVELLSNNTWRFSDLSVVPENCELIQTPVSFCDTNSRWSRLPFAPSPVINAMYQLDDRTYGMLIVESLGFRDGLTYDNFRNAILSNFAGITGTSVENVPVFAEFDGSVSGQDVESFAYGGLVEGLNFVYLNTTHLTETSASQLVTYVIGPEIPTSHRAMHDEFLRQINLEQ